MGIIYFQGLVDSIYHTSRRIDVQLFLYLPNYGCVHPSLPRYALKLDQVFFWSKVMYIEYLHIGINMNEYK